MRLIDADELKETFIVNTDRKGHLVADPEVIIDNAPTVDCIEFNRAKELIKQAYQKGKDIRPQGDLISRSELKKEFEKLGYTYRVTNIIDNATTVEPKLSDEKIEKIADLLETEWGYEGIREDVSRILRGAEE